MKIIFFGSDDFAVFHLKALLDSGHVVLATVTSPDRPQGRGMKMGISPIKQIALEKNLPCLQPDSLKRPEIINTLQGYGADIFVVVAYGRLLTQEILDIPKIFCINVHPSLLPKYRGATPIHWAILNGDSETGVTIQKMVLELDAGDIIVQKTMAIGDHEDTLQLRERMSQVGPQLLLEAIDQVQAGRIVFKPQDPSKVTYASKLDRAMGKIDWENPVRIIFNQVRGLKPWPGAYTYYKGKMLKIIQAAISTKNASGAPGEVMAVDKEGILVAAQDQGLLIKEVQPEDARVMSAISFSAGYRIATGDRLRVENF